MTTPANWGELIAALNRPAALTWGTAALQTETAGSLSWADLGVPFVKGNGMSAGGSGATQGIRVSTAGFYEIHTIAEGIWTSGQNGAIGIRLVRPRGTDHYPDVSSPSSTSGQAVADFHHVAQLQAADVIRIQHSITGPSPRVRYARITATFLGA